ncbi:adenosine deaminase [Pseudomonas chlororaphis subsp. aureofaciens]|uniref:hypothetical protein n=1 Tax=Pseudomonas chlororaphis TaxID=587753 RepID=UPI0009B894A2|nr:hypothetical protein [Pseudomonas chlororaphis]
MIANRESTLEIKELKKGDIHLHLSGAIPSTQVYNALVNSGIELPDNFRIDTHLQIQKSCDSLSEYLKPWQLLRLLPKDRNTLLDLIDHTFKSLAESNIKFVEVRHTLIHLANLCKISLVEAMLWMIEGITENGVKHDIKAGLILTISRGEFSAKHLTLLLEAYETLGFPTNVIGLDLAGHEDIESPENLAPLFRKAKEKYGLNITIHAGETGRTDRIYDAINDFSADRIGHGIASIRDAMLLNTLRSHDICLELCPLSNRFTHPLERKATSAFDILLEHEVPFVICSDNPGIQNSSLNDDYKIFLEVTNRPDILESMFAQQKKYSFFREKTWK